MALFLLVIGLAMIVSLVAIHEFGHFIVARRNGVKVEEFGIGFPPRLWSKKMKSGFLLSFNLLPLGGFVRLKGEHDADKAPHSYGAASLKTKTKIMVAGVFMNLLTAFVLLTILAWVGLPKLIDNQFKIASDTKVITDKVMVAVVEDNSPAKQAGLQPNDQLLAIGPVGQKLIPITSADNLPNITRQLAGQKVDIAYYHGTKELKTQTTLLTSNEINKTKGTKNQRGYLGVEPQPIQLTRSTWSAPLVGLGLVKQLSVLTFKGLGSVLASLFHGKVSQAGSQVTGPVGIYYILQNSSQLGIRFILVIVALISLTLAIMNILPIPALDGGRLFITLISRLFGKPLKQSTEELINGIGFIVLLLLIILITIVDVRRH